MRRFTRYVALGDSTTEGLEDPDGQGGYRGWANRFAEHLAQAHEGLTYANLAVRGRKTEEIRFGQLERAVSLQPDVATVVSGVNDFLRTSFDADEVAGHQRAMFEALIGGGATVLTFTMPDMARVMPLSRLLRGRLLALNQRLRDTCAATGAVLVDFAAHEVGGDPRLWHDDRLHANALGHERVAMGLAHAAGLPGFEGWSAPLPHAPAPTLKQQLADEARWVRGHLLPWMARHARGGSSGDGRKAKRPDLLPVR